MTNNKKFALIILDGWGKGPDPSVDALKQANTPFIDSLMTQYPNSELKTFGENVGLPEGQMGNSEVGHMNIGAGRIVYQDLVKINKAIADNELEQNKVIQNLIKYSNDIQTINTDCSQQKNKNLFLIKNFLFQIKPGIII